jgi:DNA-binding IscR family transcriptional regulator
MEGNLAPVECASSGCCDRLDRCVTVEVWKRIGNAVDEVVDNITLADLMTRYYEKSQAAAP